MTIHPLFWLTFGTSLFAHDMWIQPQTFSPAAGEIISVRLLVGQDFLGDPLPRDPSLIREFTVTDHDGRKPVVGRDGANPAGFIRIAEPGLHIIGYHSNPSTVEETAEKFNQYLKEEGLDSIPALRSGQKVRELFSRCAKSLIASPATGESDRPLGFTLELIAERNPGAMHDGEDLPVRLLYENHPLSGALVIAMNRRNPGEKIRIRTDRNGRARLRLPATGVWMVKAVHMVPAPATTNADWQSYWASLTFELPAALTGARQ